MDEFLKDIYTEVFKQWIMGKQSKDYQLFLSNKNNNIIIIKTDYCYSQIIFNPMNIIELSVTNLTNDQIEFYLHFQMKTIKHAIELFEEMLESIKRLIVAPPIKVLLSCTGGLTTAFFAEKLNDAAKLLNENYEFNAVPYANLFNVGNQYDVIMLAPQISYMHASVQEILNKKIVLKIPSLIFAKYDAGSALMLVQEQLNNSSDRKTVPIKPLSLKLAVHQDTKILCISIIRTSERVQLAYRIYDEQNKIILDEEIIKNRISLEDIYDILNVVLAQYQDIKQVGISMPGIINDGSLSLPQEGFEDYNIIETLSQKYEQKFVLNNDVNCVAVGYYASQDKYNTLSFYFQPNAGFPGGVGNIYKGQLIEGRAHIAGEVKYLPLKLSDSLAVLTSTPQGTLELVAQTMVSIITILGPEVIILGCQLISSSQIESLIKEMEKYIPRKYIPEIVKIDSLKEYILLGQMILCVRSLNQ